MLVASIAQRVMRTANQERLDRLVPPGDTGTDRSPTGPARHSRGRGVVLLVGYLAIVASAVALATLGAIYLVASVPLGLAGLLGIAGLWLGVVVSSTAIARRTVGAMVPRLPSGSVAEPPPAPGDMATGPDPSSTTTRIALTVHRDASVTHVGVEHAAAQRATGAVPGRFVRIVADADARPVRTLDTLVDGYGTRARATVVIGD